MPKLPAQPVQKAKGDAHPVLGGGLGDYACQLLSDPGGLTQFGAFIGILPPGARSSFRHWHEGEDEDEMVLLLSGEVVLVEDTKTPLRAGDVACWPAGMAIGHCIHNQSGAEACYLVIGAKHRLDVIHYPHQDLVAHKSGPVRAYFDANGRPL